MDEYDKSDQEKPANSGYTIMRILLPCCVVSCVILAGCGGSKETELPNSGKSTMLSASVSGFEIECIPRVAPGNTSLDVYWGLPAASMTFVKVPEGFQSVLEIDVRLTDRVHGGSLLETSWADTTLVQSYEQTQRRDPFEKVRRVQAPPGQWLVEVSMEDAQLKTMATRSEVIAIPDPNRRIPALGRIVVEWLRPGGAVVPFVFFHIPSGLDSLQAVIPLYHFPAGRRVDVEVTFQRFAHDTTAPLAPYLISSITPVHTWHALESENADTVGRRIVPIVPQEIVTTARVTLPALTPGLYRISARVTAGRPTGEGGDTVMLGSRVVSVKGRTFPRPTLLSELVDALAYIATPSEMDTIRSAPTPAAERDQFDLFWLRRTGNRTSAADLLRSYYTRVEEANRYFSTFNEGWKTDRGMLYIILGPPLEVRNTIGSQTWVYEYPGTVQSNMFTFTVSRIAGEGISLNEYTLQRQPVYETQWDRLVDRWRTGTVF